MERVVRLLLSRRLRGRLLLMVVRRRRRLWVVLLLVGVPRMAFLLRLGRPGFLVVFLGVGV